MNIKKNEKGFTIIEVLIVLAIAGLILLIVFLAVPALQRNSRNTQLRNDAGAVLGYINEYASNRNGQLPAAVCTSGTPATGVVYLSSDATCNNTDTVGGNIRGSVTVTGSTPASGAANQESNLQELEINLNRKCSTATAGNVDTATSNRAVAASFQVETSSTPLQQCVES